MAASTTWRDTDSILLSRSTVRSGHDVDPLGGAAGSGAGVLAAAGPEVSAELAGRLDVLGEDAAHADTSSTVTTANSRCPFTCISLSVTASTITIGECRFLIVGLPAAGRRSVFLCSSEEIKVAGRVKEGWYEDPANRHEYRWFSQGVLTDLVMDGSKTAREAISITDPRLCQSMD